MLVFEMSSHIAERGVASHQYQDGYYLGMDMPRNQLLCHWTKCTSESSGVVPRAPSPQTTAQIRSVGLLLSPIPRAS